MFGSLLKRPGSRRFGSGLLENAACVFVEPQLGEAEARRIAGVKRTVGLVALVGIAGMIGGAMTAKVAGLNLVGLDEEKALTTHLQEAEESEEELALEDVGAALDESTSFAYLLDLSSWQLLVDVLAKLLLATAVFADFALRATLASWRGP